MAGALFHSVTSWEPTPKEEGDLCTPGRISHVYFFPKKSYETLKDKPKLWAKCTAGGSLVKKEEDLEEEVEGSKDLEESVKKLVV